MGERGKRDAIVDAKVRQLEHSLKDVTWENDKHLNDLDSRHMHLQDVVSSIKGEKDASETQLAGVHERLRGIESKLLKRDLGRLEESTHANAPRCFHIWVGTASTSASFMDSNKFATREAPRAQASDPTLPRLGAADTSGLAVSPNRDYFRHVTSLILSGDDGTRKPLPRVTSLPSLTGSGGPAATR